MTSNPKLVLYATNVLGAGSGLVARRLIEGIAQVGAGQLRLEAWLPDDERYRAWSAGLPGVECRLVRRMIPRQVSRVLETVVNPPAFGADDHVLVLGDLPLRKTPNQTVFIHLAHLVSPTVDPFVSRALAYRLQRRILGHNLVYAQRVIVQTHAMGEALERSYPGLIKSIHVIGQPSPLPPVRHPRAPGERGGPFRVFFPARGMPHKNHRLLLAVARRCEQERLPVEFRVTLNGVEDSGLLHGAPRNVRNLGVLNEDELVRAYADSDALFFPSLVESYGLPLVEAMTAGLAIIVADRPYARTLCADGADYFDPVNEGSALAAVRRALGGQAGGRGTDWQARLARLPENWTDTATQFLAVMGLMSESK